MSDPPSVNQLSSAIAALSKAEMDRRRLGMSTLCQIDVERLREGFEAARRALGCDSSPFRREFGLHGERSRIRDPAVTMCRYPFE